MNNNIFYKKLDDINYNLISHLYSSGVPTNSVYRIFGVKNNTEYLGPVEGEPILDRFRYRLLEIWSLLDKIHSFECVNYGLINNGFQGTAKSWEDYIYTNYIKHIDCCYAINLIDYSQYRKIHLILGSFDRKILYEGVGKLLHGDPSLSNILWKKDGLSIIDWEDAVSGDPLYDYANFATFTDTLSVPVDKISPTFWFYFLRISIFKLLLLYQKGHKDLTRAKNRVELAIRNLYDRDYEA